MTAPDDAALAERLRRAYHAPSTLADSFPGTADRWLRVAAEARAAEGEEVARLRKIERAARWCAIAALDSTAPHEVGPQVVADMLAAFDLAQVPR